MKHKLVKCKTCGADVAKSAKACPQCGANMKRTTNMVVALLCAVIVFATTIAIINILGGGKNPQSHGAADDGASFVAPPIEVSASSLYQAYADNQVSADNQYKDQVITVTGTIANISKDLVSGAPCVSISTGDTYDLYPIQCFFPKDEDRSDAIAALSNGQVVTVTGTCQGAPIIHVQLTGCKLVP